MNLIRQAWRRALLHPARPLSAALTLGLGIAASTAAFSAVRDVVLRPLPVLDQDRIVVGWTRDPARSGFDHIPLGIDALDALREAPGVLRGVAGVWSAGAVETLVGEPPGATVARHVGVAGGFFGVLGARPTLGRLLNAADDLTGAAPVAVLGHAYWLHRYGADPGVVGRELRDGDRTFTVVGVAPEGFDLPQGTDVWVTLRGLSPTFDPGHDVVELDLVARLMSEATGAQAREHIARVLRTSPSLSGAYASLEPVVVPLADHVFGPLRPVLYGALAAALALLLAAVADTTLLLLAQGTRAARDMAIRRAVGAGRSRAAAGLLVDAAMVATAGALLGTVTAWLATRALVPLVPVELPRLSEVRLSAPAVALAVALAGVALAVSAATAGLALSRGDPRAALHGHARGASSSFHTLRRSLAGVQIALAFVSAVGAGVLLRSVHRLRAIDPGFRTEGLTILDLRQPHALFHVPASFVADLREVTRRLDAVPGILGASPTLAQPSSGSGGGLEVILHGEGQTADEIRRGPYATVDAALPGYFRTLGIPLLRGRAITDADREGAPGVVVLSESAAREVWPGQDPLGKRILGYPGQPDTWFTVVGVVPDTRYRSLVADRPAAYYALAQARGVPPSRLLVRTGAGAPARLRETVAAVFAAVDPEVQVLGEARVGDLLGRPLQGPRLAADVLSAFAAATLLVGMIGVYGVTAALVEDRRRDLGVRRALGAQTRHLVGWVARQVGIVAAPGVAAGAAGALGLTGILSSLLYGVRPTDLATFALVALGMVAVVLAAASRPAVQAARADPMESLRSE
jgi:putative ABC transport system permease protein